MFNEESYSDYIRSILGYSTDSMYANNYNIENTTYMENIDINMLEDCYPEIYKKVYPTILNVCDSNNMPITKELIENLTDEVYSKVEIDTQIGVNITLTNQITRNETNNLVQNKNREGVKNLNIQRTLPRNSNINTNVSRQVSRSSRK